MQDRSLLAFRQFNEASCGVAALRYLFSILVWPHVEHPERYMPTEERLHTKYETGTEPSDLHAYLDTIGIKHRITEGVPLDRLQLPAMVLYQWGGEGHYGVVVSATDRTIKIFNPYNARIDRYTHADFDKRWYDKPEVKWALTLEDTPTCTD